MTTVLAWTILLLLRKPVELLLNVKIKIVNMIAMIFLTLTKVIKQTVYISKVLFLKLIDTVKHECNL